MVLARDTFIADFVDRLSNDSLAEICAGGCNYEVAIVRKELKRRNLRFDKEFYLVDIGEIRKLKRLFSKHTDSQLFEIATGRPSSPFAAAYSSTGEATIAARLERKRRQAVIKIKEREK